ncbi:juxtaposed with another zinc finger protein 1b isoform X2 [Mobula birostris]
MTDAARREQESLKKKIQPKLSLSLSSTIPRGSISTPQRHNSGSLTPPVTPPVTPSSSFRSITPTANRAANTPAEIWRKTHRGCRAGSQRRGKRTGSRQQRLTEKRSSVGNKMEELTALARSQRTFRESSVMCFTETWLHEDIPDQNLSTDGFQTVRADRKCTESGSEYDEEEVDYEESDSDESWTTESAISSDVILSTMSMDGGEEKPFACPVPGCKKRYKNVNGIKYHAKNGHRTQIRVRKQYKCRCGKSYKTAQGLRHHTINFHPPVSAEIIRKMQQ